MPQAKRRLAELIALGEGSVRKSPGQNKAAAASFHGASASVVGKQDDDDDTCSTDDHVVEAVDAFTAEDPEEQVAIAMLGSSAAVASVSTKLPLQPRVAHSSPPRHTARATQEEIRTPPGVVNDGDAPGRLAMPLKAAAPVLTGSPPRRSSLTNMRATPAPVVKSSDLRDALSAHADEHMQRQRRRSMEPPLTTSAKLAVGLEEVPGIVMKKRRSSLSLVASSLLQ